MWPPFYFEYTGLSTFVANAGQSQMFTGYGTLAVCTAKAWDSFRAGTAPACPSPLN